MQASKECIAKQPEHTVKRVYVQMNRTALEPQWLELHLMVVTIIESAILKKFRAPPSLLTVSEDVLPHDLHDSRLRAEHTRLTRAHRCGAVWKGSHISGLLKATTAGPKQGLQCDKTLFSL